MGGQAVADLQEADLQIILVVLVEHFQIDHLHLLPQQLIISPFHTLQADGANFQYLSRWSDALHLHQLSP